MKDMSDIETLARTIWGEARGENDLGMVAIACVVLNRVAVARSRPNGKYWWGNGVRSVCRKAWQFSCWNANDPNLPRLLAVTEKNKDYARCLMIAEKACAGQLRDVTNGATHYFNPRVANPAWAKGEMPIITIGQHVFYRPREVPPLKA